MNPRQIVKDSIEQQFEEYVTEMHGQYEFDPYGWEPDMSTCSDSLLDAKFDNNKYGDEWYEFITELVSEVDLDDIKEEVMNSHLGEIERKRTDVRMYQQDKAEDMKSMGMSIIRG